MIEGLSPLMYQNFTFLIISPKNTKIVNTWNTGEGVFQLLGLEAEQVNSTNVMMDELGEEYRNEFDSGDIRWLAWQACSFSCYWLAQLAPGSGPAGATFGSWFSLVHSE